MSEHRAKVEWQRSGEFHYETYSRNHRIFLNGTPVVGAAAPENIPKTSATGPGVDPEQAFVAALSACHMLWFLALAAQRKWVANSVKTEVVVEPCLK